MPGLDISQLRKVSTLTIVGTVVFLVLASFFPGMTTLFAALAIVVYSVGFALWTYVWPGKRRRVVREIWVRELTPEMLTQWRLEGRLTNDEFDRMMRNIESRS